jgi:SAM-dependent methyltransferase
MSGARSADGPDSHQGYAQDADALAVLYESIAFEQIYQPVLHFLPETPGAALDIGAGTGRDAAALARRGWQVAAVEPTAELRAHGERLHRDLAIEWIDDSLPRLPALAGRRDAFDLILLTAVWMHLDADERAAAFAAIAPLLQKGGRIFMTLRHGPVPPGRRMFEVSGRETADLARNLNIHLRTETSRGDMFGRAGVAWTLLAFEKRAD